MAIALKENIFPLEGDPSSLRAMPLRALVVDDVETMVEVVCRMMEALGFWVDSADGGHAATRCLSQARYDFVVTDLNMPDMDGYALAQWVKHQTRHTKVIIMTGCHPSEVTDYLHTGIVDRWLFKPFRLLELRKMLGDLA